VCGIFFKSLNALQHCAPSFLPSSYNKEKDFDQSTTRIVQSREEEELPLHQMPTHLSFAFATQFRTTSQSQGCVQIESPIFKISKPISHLTQKKLPSMVHPYFDTIVTFVHPSPMTTEPTIRRFLYVLCPHSNFSNANLIPRNLENDVSHLTMILKLLQLNFRFNNLLKGIKCILYFNW
jgi:hypothetical protein